MPNSQANQLLQMLPYMMNNSIGQQQYNARSAAPPGFAEVGTASNAFGGNMQNAMGQMGQAAQGNQNAVMQTAGLEGQYPNNPTNWSDPNFVAGARKQQQQNALFGAQQGNQQLALQRLGMQNQLSFLNSAAQPLGSLMSALMGGAPSNQGGGYQTNFGQSAAVGMPPVGYQALQYLPQSLLPQTSVPLST